MIFDSPFFTQMLLPFLLVFVVTFAILQKSKILGDGKAQIDALVALAVGLILITYTYQTGVIVDLMAWLALGISVIFVFLVLYGFVAGDLSGSNVKPWMKVTFGVLAGIFVAGVVVYVTGFWDTFSSWIGGSSDSSMWANLLLLLLIVGAFIIALTSSKKSGSSSGSKD